nr:MAG TPA: hypothetical protein [Caudoviricetes sp.]
MKKGGFLFKKGWSFWQLCDIINLTNQRLGRCIYGSDRS